ncbi:MAG: TVP38/TMEM64 family protein [Proteobacteria bacterium]|nr:TVP38/TMEM64 family protein [Pseudomonadota bacterium]
MENVIKAGDSPVKNQSNNKKKSVVKLILFVVALVSIIAAVKLTGLDEYLDKERLQTWINSFGAWGPIVFMLIYAIAPSLFLPGLPITVVAGLAFGPFYGTLYTIIGATIGASLAFLVARYFARAQIENLVSGKLKAIDEGVEKKGWIFVAITRLIPLFPFNLLNYAFGLTKVKFSHFVIASFIFMLPGTAAYVIFSSSILDVLKGQISPELIIGLVLLLIVSVIPLIYKKYKGKKG